MWALLPIKAFHLAKQRLTSVLTASERRGLTRAMAADVIGVATQCRGFERVVVCSSEPTMAAAAHSHGAALLDDGRLGAADLRQLIDRAVAAIQVEGATACAIVHCDLPLLTCSELDRFVATHERGGSHAMTITPDRHRLGTNLLALKSLDGFSAQYGKDSFRLHCEWAKADSRTVNVCELPGAAFDIDEPEDLNELVREPRLHVGAATRRFLVESGLLARISEAREATALPD